MGLPPQERFTLNEAAARLDMDVSHVEELVSAGQFTHVTVHGDEIHHVYFDHALFHQHYPQLLRGFTEQEKTAYRARLVAQIQSSNAKQPDGPFTAVFTKAAEAAIAKIQKSELEESLEYRIGRREVAILWPSSVRWEIPNEGDISISRVALETFRKKHGLKANKNKPWDRSGIKADEWYSTSDLAGYLGLKPKSVSNRVSRDKAFRKAVGARKKPNGTWEFKGQAMLEHLRAGQGAQK